MIRSLQARLLLLTAHKFACARSIRIAVAAGLLALVATHTASAQITVFSECNFMGKPVTLSEGDFTRRALARQGVYDDDISSIVVSEGFGVRLYVDDNFAGKGATLTGIMQCLGDGFNDSISSLRIGSAEEVEAMAQLDEEPVRQAGVGVAVYAECNYRGRSTTLGNGEYSAADLRVLGIRDNSISSIQVPKGMAITLYLNDFQRGRSGRLSADNDCLAKRYNDTVSSVVVSGAAAVSGATASAKGNPALVYTGCNFRGKGARLPPGEYMAADLEKLGIADNAIASIRAPRGMQVQIFTNDFLRGRSAVVTGDESCLQGSRFEGEISSVKIVHESEAAKPKPAKKISGITVFEECGYAGKAVVLDIGEYDARALARKGLDDNSISSVKVPKGYRVIGYENDFYRGGRVTLDENQDCLTRRRADNALSSLIVEAAGAMPLNKPASTLSLADRRRLDAGITCVDEYVQQELCTSNAWKIITKNCQLNKIPLMSDGYLEGHVKGGNCIASKWDELSRRIAEPDAR